jgi:hypothetical protein
MIRQLWEIAWDLNIFFHESAVNSGSLRQTLVAVQHQLSLGPLTRPRRTCRILIRVRRFEIESARASGCMAE